MPKIIKTADGSATLYIKELDETYHSRHGAVMESKHVYIENGLRYILQHNHLKNICILEIGFGTGLNALLTYQESQINKHINFEYHSIEAYPLDISVVKQLNYQEHNNDILKLHSSEWNKLVEISSNFLLHKYAVKLQYFNTDYRFDLIYYDAFGPRAQADMWTDNILLKTASFLNIGGVLVTYCAKGEVKRIFKNAGFVVQTLKGPPGKREMIRVERLN
jgi:tRNA U34 5-methylaminomethyl-2-thiouridine-forming methyltransferase MnmC